MLTALAIIIGISFLVLVHELGHFLAAKRYGIRVEEFGIGFPPRIKGWRPKSDTKIGKILRQAQDETEYSFNWLPFGGFVKIYGESKQRLAEQFVHEGVAVDQKRAFCYQSLWRRFVVIAAGIAINVLAGWLLLSLVLMTGSRQAVVISEIVPESPAAAIGLQVGDELLEFATADEFVAFTRAHQGEQIEVVIRRAGTEQRLTPQLRLEGPGVVPLGAAVQDLGFKRVSPGAALWQGLVNTVMMMAEILRAFGGLLADIFGRAQLPENIVGPIGIFGIAQQLGDIGFVYVLQLIGMISLNLAILNALPFPALDGGRILFLLIEWVTGKPVNAKREHWAHLISFGFLLLLMLLITGRDIVRLF